MTSAREYTNGARGNAGPPQVPSIPLTEESAARIAGDTSIGGLVRDATAHLSTLVRAEVELARAEIASEIKKGVRGSVFFMIALTILLFSLFFLFMTIGYFFYDVFRWPLSVAFGVDFLLMLVVAGIFALLGYRKVRKIQAPERTLEEARETMATLRHRGEGH